MEEKEIPMEKTHNSSNLGETRRKLSYVDSVWLLLGYCFLKYVPFVP